MREIAAASFISGLRLQSSPVAVVRPVTIPHKSRSHGQDPSIALPNRRRSLCPLTAATITTTIRIGLIMTSLPNFAAG